MSLTSSNFLFPEYPDGVNHPEVAGGVLRPGETYRQTTAYRFSVEWFAVG